MNIDQALVDAVLEDWESAPVSPRQRAALRLLETMTVHPQDIDAAFVTSLKDAGLSTEDIEEAASTGFQFNLINRLADAFDFDIPSEEGQRKQAVMLQVMGRLGGAPPSPSWSAGEDGLLRPVELTLAREHLLSTDGELEPALRQAIEAHAARAWGGQRSEAVGGIPEAITEYVNRLALYAYRLTDELFDGLKTSGYSEAQIFEITLAGALGASFVAIERLFEALHGETCRAA